MLRKVIFWLAPNEILIPADQVPGAIADALYPRPVRNEKKGRPLNDPNMFMRLEEERELAGKLREKYPNSHKFSAGELMAYLEELKTEDIELEAEVRNRSVADVAASTIGWDDTALKAGMWFGRSTIKPRKAALLLCQLHPHDTRIDPHEDSTDKIEPSDFKRLLHVFDDIATDGRPRTLQEWLNIARGKGLKYHSWIDGYVESKSVVTAASTLASHNGPIADKNQIIDGFLLEGKRWPDILSKPDRDGRRYKAAFVQKGKRGIQKGGGRAATLWNPIVFARLLIELENWHREKVKARFLKVKDWAPYEAEMLAEIGEI